MEIIRDIRLASKEPLCVALGFFDGVHLGHRRIIEDAVKYADNKLVPTIFTFSIDSVDEKFPNKKMHSKNIITQDQKLELFREMGIKKLYMPVFDEIKNIEATDFIEDVLVKNLNAKALVCGEDFKFGKNRVGDVNLLKSRLSAEDIDVCVPKNIISDGSKISSTQIREYIKEGNISLANKLLGYDYNVYSYVVYGLKLGRQIGFRTVNQIFEDNILVPRYGVYSTVTHIEGKSYKSISNIGVRPTIDNSCYPICETHILGIDKNLYGEKIKVEFSDFIRSEVKFNSIEELKEQISKDVSRRINLN